MRILQDFNERLSELMFERNLTIEQLGKSIGISNGNISNWKTGKQNISLTNAKKLADFFQCSLEYLIGRTDTRLDYSPYNEPPFYNCLMKAMDKYKKSRYRIVKDTKLSDGNFYSWSKGSDPFLQTVVDLADYFGCTVDHLVGREK